MSPRAYRLGQRQATTDQTRARIIEATRELLMAPDGLNGFSIEAVAKQANVARMTVYYQFGSKTGLLEALCDSLGSQGGMEQLRTAFMKAEPLEALAEYVNIFGRFWESDRLVTRRLRSMANLDPDFEQVITTRDEWRRKGLTVLVQRLAEQPGQKLAGPVEELVNVLSTLVSFEFFDLLAGKDRQTTEVSPTVYRLACAALGVTG